MIQKRPVAEVKGDALFVEVGLAEEKVAALGRSRERLGPLGVPGVSENPALDLEAKDVGGSAALVADLMGTTASAPNDVDTCAGISTTFVSKWS